MELKFTKPFVRQLRKLEPDLIIEALEKTQKATQDIKHPSLKAHPLSGSLAGNYSLWVNYKYRVVFRYIDSQTIELFAIGDHSLYK